jgi:hypothetical protein
MENALDYPVDLYDDVHPDDAGYDKMALVWFEALSDFLATYCFGTPVSYPQLENLVLGATSPDNLITDDLVCSYDLTGTATTAATAWYMNGNPLMTHYMPFEGGEINALQDFSGSNNHGNKGGSIVWDAGAGFDGNGAFEFNNDGYINLGADSFPDGSYTKTAWIKWYNNGGSYENILGSSTINGHAFALKNDVLIAGHRYDNNWEQVVDPGGALEEGTWHFVAVTYDIDADPESGEGKMTLYKGGIPIAEAMDVRQHATGGSEVVYIGAFNAGFMFTGVIDEVRIYPYAVSPEQILAMYDDGLGNANVIVSQETEAGDDWQADVTPFSSVEKVLPYLSNTLTIQETPIYQCLSSTDLMAYWSFNEGIGNTAFDSSDNGQDGTLHGPTWTDAGKYGKAVVFDGVNDYVSISDFEYGQEFSVSFWFKSKDNSGSLYQYIFSHGAFDKNNSLNLYFVEDSEAYGGGILRTAFRDTNDGSDITALDVEAGFADGGWHHYVLMVSEGAGSIVYIDGEPKNSSLRGGDSFNPSTDIYLGGREDLNPDRHFNGETDEVRIYNRALSIDEIQVLYTLGNLYCQCSDGLDNDGDGLTDYPSDPGCASSTDDDEYSTPLSVDSTYSGYSTAPIDDEIIDPYGGTSTTWASKESSTQPHWIVTNFPEPRKISTVTIYWAYNSNKQKFMSSQEVRVQYWDGTGYSDAATIINTEEVQSSFTTFPEITTTSLRLYQPANMGHPDYTRVMWLTEIDY